MPDKQKKADVALVVSGLEIEHMSVTILSSGRMLMNDGIHVNGLIQYGLIDYEGVSDSYYKISQGEPCGSKQLFMRQDAQFRIPSIAQHPMKREVAE